MTGMDKAVLGEALQTAIGEAEVQALVFTTHDLDPQFFEAEILPVFLGNDLKHTQRTRQVQLEHEIRGRDVAIDVYYEGRALAAHEGAARLGWSRLQMSGRHGGVFHPKVVMALCVEDEVESLVVSGLLGEPDPRWVVDQPRGGRRLPSRGRPALRLPRRPHDPCRTAPTSAAPRAGRSARHEAVRKFLASTTSLLDLDVQRSRAPDHPSRVERPRRRAETSVRSPPPGPAPGSHLTVPRRRPAGRRGRAGEPARAFQPRSTTLALPLLGTGTPLPRPCTTAWRPMIGSLGDASPAPHPSGRRSRRRRPLGPRQGLPILAGRPGPARGRGHRVAQPQPGCALRHHELRGLGSP